MTATSDKRIQRASLEKLLLVFLFVSFSTCETMSGTMKAVQYEVGCSPEELTVGTVPLPTLKEFEILIKVFASGITRADTNQRKGGYPPPPGASKILGLEASGIVEEVGPGVTKWKKGGRVMALLAGGGNAEYVAVHEGHVAAVPEGFSLLDSGGICEVWMTAYQLLHMIGRVKTGDVVLIHAGASGVGLALVQLARHAGATSIVTAGSAAKIRVAIDAGAAHGFNYKEEDFAEKVLEVTEGQGVNIVFDCVGSSHWEKNMRSLRVDGTWILYGLLSGGEVNGSILSQLMKKRIRLEATTLRGRSTEYKSKLVEEFAQDVIPLFADGRVKVFVDQVFPLDKIGEAHRVMEQNANTGKLLIKIGQEESSHTEL